MGISIQHLLVVLVIVILIFGTKRLKNIGADLGDAIKGFRNAVKEGEDSKNLSVKEEDILEGEITHKDNDKV